MRILAMLAHRFWGPFSLFLLAAAGLIGLVALVSPGLFERLVDRGDHWVDTTRWLALLDKRFDVDRYVLPHARLLGALVIAVVLMISVFFCPIRFLH
jgi:hypothetical protein